MLRRLLYCLFVAVIAVPVPSFAGDGPGPLDYRGYATNLSAVDISTDQVSSVMNVGGYNNLSITVNLVDANSSVTSVDVTCEKSWDGTSRWGWITAKNLDGSTGISTSKKFTDRLPLSGSGTYVSDWGINAQYMRCTFHANGAPGAATDLITVDIRASVG